MAIRDAVNTVLNRNAYYRDGYRLLLRISLVQGIAIALLLMTIVGLILMMNTRYVYFATTSDGRIINIVPLDDPFRSRADVVAWAASKGKDVMRMNYYDYRQRLQESSNNFTPAGWDTFTHALKDARYIEALEAHKLIMAMNIEAAPEVERAYVSKEGVYTWNLQFPATITFEGNEKLADIRVNIYMTIVRVSTLQNPDGISIAGWVAKVRGGE